jgi:hypothetical protein
MPREGLHGTVEGHAEHGGIAGCLARPAGPYVGTVTHIAGPEIQAGSHMRQRCAWCGVILADTRTHGPAMWAPGDLVRNDGDAWHVRAREEGADLPADSCTVMEADVLTEKYGPA